MPLNTQILRNNEELTLPWSGFHVTCMILASVYDSGKGPFVDNSGPQFQYGEEREIKEEWRGKDGSSYPDVPCPVTQGDVFRLTNYIVIGQTPLNKGRYTLKRAHKFVNCVNSEVFELLPGDVLIAYRTSK